MRLARYAGASWGRDLADLELPRWLVAFVSLVVLADVVVLAVGASTVTVHLRDIALFGGLLACSAITVEMTRRVGENTGFVKDVYATWELPVAILLPLPYAPVLPIIRFALTQWRILKAPVYRRAFSASAIGLSYVAAALVFHALIRLAPRRGLGPGPPRPGLDAGRGGLRRGAVVRQPVPGLDRDQGLEPGREHPRGAVRQGADLQRPDRALRRGARHVLPGLQLDRTGLRVPVHHLAAAVRAARPAAQGLAGGLQDRPAERRHLGARGRPSRSRARCGPRRRSPSPWWTSTGSRRSTTRTVTCSATRCCREIARTMTTPAARLRPRLGGSAARNSRCCSRRPGPSTRSASRSGSGRTSPRCRSSRRAPPAGSGCTSPCRSGWRRWTPAPTASFRAAGGGGRGAVPGQAVRPGPGADDQHDQGPERGQQRLRRHRRHRRRPRSAIGRPGDAPTSPAAGRRLPPGLRLACLASRRLASPSGWARGAPPGSRRCRCGTATRPPSQQLRGGVTLAGPAADRDRAPPPLPATWPALILAAYSFSTRIAVAQLTVPLTTLMTTGTSAAVRVVPQVPAPPARPRPRRRSSPPARQPPATAASSRPPASTPSTRAALNRPAP